MRRSDVDDFWRRLFRWPRDRDAIPINRSWNHCCSCETKDPAGLVKSRIFDPRNFTLIHQGHCADHHCLLCSSGDDDLVWMTACASVIAQISCERFAQVGVATARRILEEMGPFLCEDFRPESFPYCNGKF